MVARLVAVLAVGMALAVVAAAEVVPPPPLPDLRDTLVTLHWDDFKRLVEASFPDQPERPAPPQPFSIDRAGYQAEVRRGFTRVTAQLTVTVLEPEQWVTVPLVGGVAVTDVRGLKDAVVVSGGTYQLVAHGAGTRTFELDFTVKGGDRPGQNALSFAIPQAAVSYLRVVAAGDVVKVEAPELVGVTSEQDGRVLLAAVPQTGSLSLSYELPLPKDEGAGAEEVKKEPKVFVEEETLATVGEGLMALRTTYRYQVLHAPVTAFRFAVPDGVDVLAVDGENLVEGFKILKEGETGRTLEVRANFEVKGDYVLTISYEKDLGGTDVTAELVLLDPLAVERATGVVGFEAEANAEVEPRAVERMVPLDVTEIPAVIWDAASNPLLLGYRYLERPFRLELAITKHEDQPVKVAACDSAFVTMLVTEDGGTLVRALLNLRNNRKQFLEVRLPEGADIWSAFIRERAVKPAMKKDAQGQPLTLIPLPRSIDRGADDVPSAAGEQAFPLEIVYFLKAEPVGRLIGTETLVTPAVDVPISQLGLSVYLPLGRSYHYLSGSLRPVDGYAGSLFPSLPIGGLTSRGYAPAPAASAPGRQFDDGERFAEEQKSQDQSFRKKVSSKAYEKAATAGSLPVRISFPEEGVSRRFRKLLSIEEAASVRLFYVHASVAWVVRMLCRLLGIVVGVALVRIARRRVQTGNAEAAREVAAILISLAVVGGAYGLLEISPDLFVAWGLVSLLGYGGFVVAQTAWRFVAGRRRAPSAPVDPTPPPA